MRTTRCRTRRRRTSPIRSSIVKPASPPPRTVTTLHGTDITLVGNDPSYARVVAFSIEQSHGVTTVSESLKRDTVQALGIRRDLRVIPNFLECCGVHAATRLAAAPRGLLASGPFDAVVIHVSELPAGQARRVGARRVREDSPAGKREARDGWRRAGAPARRSSGASAMRVSLTPRRTPSASSRT